MQAGFRKGRGTRGQTANISWIIEKARKCQKNIYFCFTDYTKAFDCVDYNKLWKILKEMGIPDHLTCLLRNLPSETRSKLESDMGQRAGSKLGKEYIKAVLSPCLFTFYAEYIMWNDHLDDSQAGIKIARRNITTSDDTTLMAESEEELKSLVVRVKKEWKSWLEIQHSKN